MVLSALGSEEGRSYLFEGWERPQPGGSDPAFSKYGLFPDHQRTSDGEKKPRR